LTQSFPAPRTSKKNAATCIAAFHHTTNLQPV